MLRSVERAPGHLAGARGMSTHDDEGGLVVLLRLQSRVHSLGRLQVKRIVGGSGVDAQCTTLLRDSPHGRDGNDDGARLRPPRILQHGMHVSQCTVEHDARLCVVRQRRVKHVEDKINRSSWVKRLRRRKVIRELEFMFIQFLARLSTMRARRHRTVTGTQLVEGPLGQARSHARVSQVGDDAEPPHQAQPPERHGDTEGFFVVEILAEVSDHDQVDRLTAATHLRESPPPGAVTAPDDHHHQLPHKFGDKFLVLDAMCSLIKSDDPRGAHRATDNVEEISDLTDGHEN
mmetsp:Transcript_8207/g.22692  ORF Transcript_8207/g.22692 Transcript_8207/m.22692 type:complete len:289 (-) Transcript_8207:1145-2011(-)